MRCVITLSAKAEHGKDTMCDFLKEELKAKGFTVQRVAFADAVKQECRDIYGWNGIKDEAGRKLLQEHGNKMRQIDPLYWIKKAEESFKDVNFIIITDARYKNECDYWEGKGYSSIAVRITRYDKHGKLFQNKLTEEQRLHISEVDLDDYDFDIRVSTVDGLESVRCTAKYIANDIT